MLDMIKQLSLAAPLALVVSLIPAFAQETEPAALYDTTQADLKLNVTCSEKPMLGQLSEKVINKVLLRWPLETPSPILSLSPASSWQAILYASCTLDQLPLLTARISANDSTLPDASAHG